MPPIFLPSIFCTLPARDTLFARCCRAASLLPPCCFMPLADSYASRLLPMPRFFVDSPMPPLPLMMPRCASYAA